MIVDFKIEIGLSELNGWSFWFNLCYGLPYINHIAENKLIILKFVAYVKNNF